MRNLPRFLLAALLTSACSAEVPPPTNDTPDPELPRTGVDLVRDARGVPHLYAATLADAMYGLGYATAQDRLFQMQLRRMTMRGRLAEMFAVDASVAGAQAFNAKLVASDRAVRTMGYARHAEETAGNLPGDIPALLQAYADGVNAYLASDGFALPTAFVENGLEKPEPWTPADSLLAWEWVGHHFSGALNALQLEIDNYVDCADGSCSTPLCDLPVDDSAAVVQLAPGAPWPPDYPPAPALPPANGIFAEDVVVKASHGWVVHGSRTTTGKPVLVAEPQLALEAPSTWYEYHLHTDTVNARGAGFAGAPGYVVFWNDHVAQTATAGGADIADLFELTLTADRTGYVIDGVAQPIATHTETIAVRHGAPISLIVRDTMLGPIIDDVLERVPSGKSFAARHIEHVTTSTHSIVAAIDLARATGLASYREALSHWATPAINALYAGVDADAPADDPGHIAYHALTRIPQRTSLALGGRDYTGRHPYDGSTSAAVWTQFYGIDWNPHVIDPAQGYAFSGNHRPITKAYDDHLYAGFAGIGDTYRSLQLRYRFAELLPAGTNRITPEQIHALHFDDGSEVARVYSNMLAYLAARGVATDPGDLAAEPATRAEKAARVRIALAAWVAAGGHLKHSDPNSVLVGATISKMGTLSRWQANPVIGCQYNGGQGGASAIAKAFDANAAAMMNADVTAYVLAVAEAAWNEARPSLPGPSPATWPVPTVPMFTVMYQKNFGCLVPGGGGVCSLTPAYEQQLQVDQAYGDTLNSAAGSSYPVTVDFADVEATRALLPPGVSEDPASPFFDDGLPAIVAKGQGDVSSIPQAARDRSVVDATATTTLHLDQ